MLEKIGSRPPAGSKNEVLIFLSNNNIVIRPAKTGSTVISRITVIYIDQQYKFNFFQSLFQPLKFYIVVMKFMEPNIEDNPARCRLKIVKSLLGPGCPSRSDNGG